MLDWATVLLVVEFHRSPPFICVAFVFLPNDNEIARVTARTRVAGVEENLSGLDFSINFGRGRLLSVMPVSAST